MFLDKRLYESLMRRLRQAENFREKQMQIFFANVLHNEFGVKRIFNESKYRYHDNSRGYYSDMNQDHCLRISRKQTAARCDLRLLSPPCWIELKLDKAPDAKDLDNLFRAGAGSFTDGEARYAISVWRNAGPANIETSIDKLKHNLPPEVKTKVLQIDGGVVISVIFHL